jgi:predicted XRE-type DNA-binding protein
MKPVAFLGDLRERIRAFPERSRWQVGFELRRVQLGMDPSGWKPMKSVGQGVRENSGTRCAWGVPGSVRGDCIGCRVRPSCFSKEGANNHETRLGPGHNQAASSEVRKIAMQPKLKRQSFANVWDALEDGPAAANMTMRSDLLIALQRRVGNWKVTQAEAARRLEISQPRLNDLLRGRIAKFSLDMLVTLADRADIHVRLHIDKAA